MVVFLVKDRAVKYTRLQGEKKPSVYSDFLHWHDFKIVKDNMN